MSPALTLAPALVVLAHPHSHLCHRRRPRPRALVSSPSTSCRHLHRSHLGYCPCVVTVVVVAVSYSPCLCYRRHVIALIVVHAIIPILVIVLALALFVPRPRHHRPHCPSPLPLFSVRLTVALASHIIPMLALRGVTASRWRWLPDSCGFCVLQASTVGLVTLSRPECVCLSCRLFIAYLMTHLVFLVSLRPHCCKLDLLSTSTPRCFELVIRSFTC